MCRLVAGVVKHQPFQQSQLIEKLPLAVSSCAKQSSFVPVPIIRHALPSLSSALSYSMNGALRSNATHPSRPYRVDLVQDSESSPHYCSKQPISPEYPPGGSNGEAQQIRDCSLRPRSLQKAYRKLEARSGHDRRPRQKIWTGPKGSERRVDSSMVVSMIAYLLARTLQ